MKRILFLTNLPSPYRVCFFSELGRLCDLTVIYERYSASDREDTWKASAELTYKEIYLSGKTISTDNSFCLDVIRYLGKDIYDEIIIGMYSTYTAMLAILCMNIRKMKFSISTDGGFVKEENKLAFKIKKYLIGSANKWYSTGKVTDEYLIHYGADANKIVRYPFTSLYSEDILDHQPTKEEKKLLRDKLGIAEEKMVLYVGQFIHRKGIDVLLDAAKKSDIDFGLYLIGGRSQEYEEYAEKLGLKNVHQIDFLRPEDLEQYYRAADLFVLPTREDIWGLVVNEAMAKGLPVVTTDKCVAGLELVSDTNGKIVKVEDSDELASAISYILNNDEVRQSMAEKSIHKIQDYTFSNMARAYYEAL